VDVAVVAEFGPLVLSRSAVTAWGLSAALAIGAALATRRLVPVPGRLQTALEGLVGAMESAIEAMAPGRGRMLLPMIGTLWIAILAANLAGLVPGLDSPTADFSVTAALALLVMASVHWFGIRISGVKGHLRHYLQPSPLLLPFHIISELTRTLALAVRLFGNMMSLELVALILLLLAGFLVPVPVLLLHVVEALIQAYIFGMLALAYIAGGIEILESERNPRNGESP
jgi:F-type H+-transporting ATPase subunit a